MWKKSTLNNLASLSTIPQTFPREMLVPLRRIQRGFWNRKGGAKPCLKMEYSRPSVRIVIIYKMINVVHNGAFNDHIQQVYSIVRY